MAIFGADDRVALQSGTDAPPLAAFSQVLARFSDGVVTQGSGVMIGPASLLTAAHAIYHPDHGGWAEQVQVVPGRLGSIKPYGVFEAVSLSTPSPWRVPGALSYEILKYDYGVVTLGSAIGYVTGWLDYGYNQTGTGLLLGKELLNIGYPADLGGNSLYFDTGTVDRVADEIMYFTDDLDIMPGQSGSPVIYDNNGMDVVLGVVSHQLISPDENGVLGLSESSVNAIQGWVSQEGSEPIQIELNPQYQAIDIALATQVVRLIEVIYDQQPGYTLLTDFKNQSTEMGLARFADSLVAAESALSVDAVLASTVTVNAGITGDAAQIAYDYLMVELMEGPTHRGEVILKASTLLSALSEDSVFGDFAVVFNAEVVNSLAYSVIATNTDYRTVAASSVIGWLSSEAALDAAVSLTGVVDEIASVDLNSYI